MSIFIHPQAIVETDRIGEGTRIWAFTHILPGVAIGKECNLCDHVFVENGVVIGDRVTIKCGVQLWEGVTLEDDVFVGPNATFTNDPFPRSKHYPKAFAKTVVKKGASIGANTTILPGVTIGEEAMIGAGAVVVKDIPPRAIVVGNPARITGYIDQRPKAQSDILQVKGVRVFEMPLVGDINGCLTYGEFPKHLPFIPQRYFLIYDVPSQQIRGEHAHKTLEEFLVCVRGSVVVALDDGEKRGEIILDNPQMGLLIPPRVWGIQYKYSADAALMVLASDIYRPEDYIRNYNEFLEWLKSPSSI